MLLAPWAHHPPESFTSLRSGEGGTGLSSHLIWGKGLQWIFRGVSSGPFKRPAWLGAVSPYDIETYHKTSYISCTKFQNLNVSNLVLVNPLKPGVKSRMKMLLEQRRQAMLQIHLS